MVIWVRVCKVKTIWSISIYSIKPSFIFLGIHIVDHQQAHLTLTQIARSPSVLGGQFKYCSKLYLLGITGSSSQIENAVSGQEVLP